LNVNISHLPFRRTEREKIALWAILAKGLPAGKKREGLTEVKKSLKILFQDISYFYIS
jgi:hypothetical protein